MKHTVLLRVSTLLVVVFCIITTIVSSSQPAAQPHSDLDNHFLPSAFFSAANMNHLPRDTYQVQYDQCRPRVLQLRDEGKTPQEICSILAREVFNDKSKYNTIKYWHQREFPEDWPLEDIMARMLKRQPPTITSAYHQRRPPPRRPQQQHHQLPQGYDSRIAPAASFSQNQQNYPQSYGGQPSSIPTSFPRPTGVPRRGPNQNVQFQRPTADASFQQDGRQYSKPASVPSPIPVHNYGPSGGQGRYQGHPSSTASPGWPGQSGIPYQHQPKYNHNDASPQMPIGMTQQPRQPAFTQYHQNGYSQTTPYIPEGTWRPIPDIRAKPNESSARYTHHNGQLHDEHPPGGQSPVKLSPSELDDALRFINNCGNDFGMDAGVDLSADGQQFTMQNAVTPNQPLPDFDGQELSTQASNHQNIRWSGGEAFPMDLTKARQPSTSPNFQYSPSTAANPNEMHHPSPKTPIRSSLVHVGPTPPPSYPLPPSPPRGQIVIPMSPNISRVSNGMAENSMAMINPNEFPQHNPRKRPRKELASATRDSVALSHERMHAIPRIPTSDTMQTSAAQVPPANELVKSSNRSTLSSFRDSSYYSELENSVRSSLSSFTVNDTAELNTNCQDGEDGYVDIHVQATWRVRKSYIQSKDPQRLSTWTEVPNS